MDILKSIDIALGMIVIYLIFALGVTAFNEALAAWFNSRAKWLSTGIKNLLTPTSGSASTTITEDNFYDSPFISFLGDKSNKKSFKPSYLPPWTLLQGMLDVANEKKGEITTTIENIETAAKKLPEGSPIRAVILDIHARADGKLEEFRKLFEEWFQSFEAQVTAWYRQKTQYVLVMLSAVLVVGTNLDTITLLKQLASNTKVRDALVQKALETAKKEKLEDLLDHRALDSAKSSLVQAQNELKEAEAALKLATESKDKDEKQILVAKTSIENKKKVVSDGDAKVNDEQKKYEETAIGLMKDVTSTRIQVGWTHEEWKRLNDADSGVALGKWLVKLLGLLLSAAALSLGAPFWFDLLKKVASIRAVGLSLAEATAKKAKPVQE